MPLSSSTILFRSAIFFWCGIAVHWSPREFEAVSRQPGEEPFGVKMPRPILVRGLRIC